MSERSRNFSHPFESTGISSASRMPMVPRTQQYDSLNSLNLLSGAVGRVHAIGRKKYTFAMVTPANTQRMEQVKKWFNRSTKSSKCVKLVVRPSIAFLIESAPRLKFISGLSVSLSVWFLDFELDLISASLKHRIVITTCLIRHRYACFLSWVSKFTNHHATDWLSGMCGELTNHLRGIMVMQNGGASMVTGYSAL